MMVATLGIALPELRQSFSLSEVEAGSLFSIALIVAALSSTIAGRLADKFGSKTVLVTGLSLLALGFGGAGMSKFQLLFFLFLGLTGLGYGFTPPSLYALMSNLLPNRRGLGVSLVSVSYGIGGAIGAVLASRIIAVFGWRAAFVTVGAIAAVDMLLQLYWIRNVRPTRLDRALRLFHKRPLLPALYPRTGRIHRRFGVLELRSLDPNATPHG